jgi:hypothetical protein
MRIVAAGGRGTAHLLSTEYQNHAMHRYAFLCTNYDVLTAGKEKRCVRVKELRAKTMELQKTKRQVRMELPVAQWPFSAPAQ